MSGVFGGGGAGGGAPTTAGYVLTAPSAALTAETLIGAIILPPGVLGDRPAAATVPDGALYFATDVGTISRSTGAAWVDAYNPDDLTVVAPFAFDPAPPAGTQVLTAPGVPALVASLTPNAGIVNDATNQPLSSDVWQSAANELEIGDVVHVVAFGTYLNNTGSAKTITLRVQADGVTQCSGALLVTVAAAVNYRWRLDAWIPIDTATTTKAGGVAAVGNLSGSADTAISLASLGAAVDLTQPIDWRVSAQHSAADPNLNVVMVAALIELYRV